MPAPIYDCATEGAVSLSAATTKTVVGVRAHANSGLLLLGYEVAFLGVTASEVPALVEVCYCTFGANPPGTNSTSTTPRQRSGRVIAAGFTSARNWTSEPTTSTAIIEKLLTPNGGLIIYDFPLGKELDSAVAEGFTIRITAPSATSVRATLNVSRC